MKRWLVLALALCLALTMMGIVPAATAEGEPKTLRVMVSRSPGVIDFDTNEYVLWLEEQTGIDVQWEQVANTSVRDKLPVVMMGGDLPDAIMGFGLNAAQQVNYGVQEKLFIPLNGLIEEYGVEIKRMFAEQPGVEDLITMADGNIYALPTYSDIIHCNYAQKFQINTTFLDVLGMEMPTTTDEFYDYLKAVKENDPNGNGIADEIPMIGCLTAWHEDPFCWLMEPFIFDDGMYGKKVDLDENGKIFSILDKEGYRDGLRYIKKLYSEGLLYEGSLTMPFEQTKAIGENPDAMILGGKTTAGVGGIAEVGGERYQNYRALPPIEGPTGLRQTPWFRYANVRIGAYAITKDCEDTETALKLADFMLSYESTMRLRMGVKGVDWRDAEEGETTFDGRPAVWARIKQYTGEAQNQHLDNDGIFYETRGMFLDDCAYDHSKTIMDTLASQHLLAVDTVERYVEYAKEVLPPVTVPAEYSEEFYPLEAELKIFYEQARAAFISGAMDLDADWDGYVNDLKAIGLDRYLEILQIAYDQGKIKIGA